MRSAALLLGALALLAAACGGGGSAERDASAKLAERQWAQRADQICRRVESRVVRRPQPRDDTALEAALHQLANDVREAVAEIRRLRPAPGRAAERFLADARAAERHLQRIAAASGPARVKRIRDLEAEAVDYAIRAGGAGLRVCGRDASWRAFADGALAAHFIPRFLEVSRALDAGLRRAAQAGKPDDRLYYAIATAHGAVDALESPKMASGEVAAYYDLVVVDLDLRSLRPADLPARLRSLARRHTRAMQRVIRALELPRTTARGSRR